jgi:hypothetical protein
MNGLQRRSELPPLVIAHPDDHRILAGDKWIENQAPFTTRAPEFAGSRLQRRQHVANSALRQCPGDDQPGLVDRSEPDLEEIGGPLPGEDLVDGGAEIVAEGKKRDRAHAQVVLHIETGGYRVEIQPRVVSHDTCPGCHVIRPTAI